MPNLEQILKALKNAHERQFWGQIQIDFQRGIPVLIRTTETQKFQSAAIKEMNNRYGYNR